MNIKPVSITTAIGNEAEAPDSQQYETLIGAAREAARRAYAPYSHFRVGAAALLSNGQIVTGNNQENAAYPSGLCAERVTVFSANATYPDAQILHLMICAETDAGIPQDPITPCGACRQVLVEKESAQKCPMRISLAGRTDVYTIAQARQLLPLTFDADALEAK